MTQYYNSRNDYDIIRDYILNGRSKIERKVAHNTIARIDEDTIIIKYHASDIVFLTDDSIRLESDGYKTSTTKERLNWYIPKNWYLYQQNHIWYIKHFNADRTWIFKDGLTFYNLEGTNSWDLDLNTCGDPSEIKRIKEIKKRINKYTNKFINQLVSGKMDKPGAGDCWYCSMQTENDGSLGEATNSIDHLESHFDENYLVPSMLMNAIRFYSMSPVANSILHDLWFNPTGRDFGSMMDIFKNQAKSSLKKFLMREFQIA